ncbi:MAG: VOC family protein [Nitrososphaeria archaeon]|jgi:predicted enzyme related to lactoylglutathione lyase
MDKVVHFEIPAEDVKRAKKFYESVFGWQTNDIPEMDYTMLITSPTDERNMPKEKGAINGGMMKRSDKVKSPLVTISVSDIDDAVKKLEKAGGKLVLPKVKVEKMGFSAYFKDTEGNVVGLWQNLG